MEHKQDTIASRLFLFEHFRYVAIKVYVLTQAATLSTF